MRIIHSEKLRYPFAPMRNRDKPYSLFYDETNNIRRLVLSEGGMNAQLNQNFVLGGIVLQAGKKIGNIDALRASMRIQPSAQELKLKQVAFGDYEVALNSQRLTVFLQYLLEQNILIHYSKVSFLYWLLIDIIDSLLDDDDLAETYGLAVSHTPIKAELYDVVMRSPDEFLSLMHTFSYPNVAREQSGVFLKAISEFIDRHSPENRTQYMRMLKDLLRQASHLNELVFLHDNEPGDVLSNFSHLFLRGICEFNKASHIFDRETNIERILQTTEVRDGTRRIDYQFVDSKDNVCVQLSDVVVGLLGKHFDYVEKHSLATLRTSKARFNEIQQTNLALIKELIGHSDRESEGFCHSISSLDSAFKNDMFLHGREVPPHIK